MISRKELEAFGKMLGFNAYQAEKDYLQHAFLSSIYSVSSNEFVFKGGTALQKVYGLNRFSEDLDFTFDSPADPQPFIGKAVAGNRAFTETAIASMHSKGLSFTAKLKLKGPLFSGSERSLQTIYVEASLREKPLLKTVTRSIVPPYTDLPPYIAVTMAPEEILAEKIRAALTRSKARDLYDLWFLLRKGIRFDSALADRKLAYYGEAFIEAKFEKNVKAKEKGWESELGRLVKSPPTFKEVSSYVISEVKRKRS